MTLQHVVESQQFTVPLLMELFERTREMERMVARGGTRDYSDKIMASLFYEQRRVTIEKAHDLRESADMHRRIYQAIRSRDAEAARSAGR